MKCYLCGKKIEEDDFYAKSIDNEYYHLSVQDCQKKMKEEYMFVEWLFENDDGKPRLD